MTDTTIKPLWDDRGPFFTRMYNTWMEITFHPIRFFANMPTNAGIGKPYLYFLITGFLGALAGALWVMMMLAVMMIPILIIAKPAETLPVYVIFIIFAVFILLQPIISTIMTFIMAGIYHLSLMIFKGNKKGFEATFRSLAYSAGSASIFSIVPFFGVYAVGIWAIILTIIGFKESHQIPTVKAILAYLVPFILCTCIMTVAMVIPMIIFMSYAISKGH
jgi:hypothetical protein